MPKILTDDQAALLSQDKTKKLAESKPIMRSDKPTLTNRGPAGLLKKLTDEQKARIVKSDEIKAAEVALAASDTPKAKYRIAPGLTKVQIVPVDSLVPDPENARLHPERNLKAIKASLFTYGQVKPLVVRRKGNIVVAGNGTLECAKALGWKDIAVTFVDMTHIQGIGYGLADNRTAELARWHTETIARLDKLLLEAKYPTIGWSMDELEVMRAADWTPPVVEEGDSVDGDGSGFGGMDGQVHTVKLTVGQMEWLDKVVKAYRDRQPDEETKATIGEVLEGVCREWLGEDEGAETVDVEDGVFATEEEEEVDA